MIFFCRVQRIISLVVVPIIGMAVFYSSFLFLKLPCISSKIAYLATKISISQKYLRLIIPMLISSIFSIGALVAWTLGVISANKTLKNKPILESSYKTTLLPICNKGQKVHFEKGMLVDHLFPFLTTRQLFNLRKVNYEWYSVIKSSLVFKERIRLLSHELRLRKEGAEGTLSRGKIIEAGFDRLYTDGASNYRMFFDFESKVYWRFCVITDLCKYYFTYYIPGRYTTARWEEGTIVDLPEGSKQFTFEISRLNLKRFKIGQWIEIIEKCIPAMMFFLEKSRLEVIRYMMDKIRELSHSDEITREQELELYDYLSRENRKCI